MLTVMRCRIQNQFKHSKARAGADVFAHEVDVKIFDMDRSRQVDASLGWSIQMKALTAASITAMCDALKPLMAQLETPLLIFHDPKDSIAKIEGSRKLMELATCKRQLFEIQGGLHAPHFNKQAEVEELTIKFLNGCLASFPVEAAGPRDVEKAAPRLPVGLQRLQLQSPAFERFPLPGKCYETLVLSFYFLCLMTMAFSPTLVAVAVDPEVGGWVLLGFGIYLQLVALGIIINYAKAILKLRRACRKPLAPLKSVPFAMLIPMYNEDFEVLQPGLQSINMQPQARCQKWMYLDVVQDCPMLSGLTSSFNQVLNSRSGKV